MGVDISNFPVKEISSTYNDRAFSSMGYVLDEGVWVKKASYKPKIKNASPEGPSGVKIDGSQDALLNSLLYEAQDIKQSLVQWGENCVIVISAPNVLATVINSPDVLLCD
ncbi:hypothetical protein HAX54_002019 [Datura stramonium]|uniref:Uncharacterized protein n=1 Tax=Datura stramonium TaxID=4076 RepID=A0ABS8T5I1_DATST|nr:hypothetical protein [Datura stramonium]